MRNSSHPFAACRQPGWRVLGGVLLCLSVPWLARTAESAEPPGVPRVSFQSQAGALVVSVEDQPIASYVYEDRTSKIPRPYFAHVKAPGGIQVTRNHPPVPGEDREDHATMHPGIWLAFGDLDGQDFWRNKASVTHVRLAGNPQGGPGSGSFVQEKRYLRADGSVVCSERFHCQVHVRPSGYLLLLDSTFHAETPFYFGDQEEMGLGLRVATPLSEIRGGQLRDSEGRQGAQAIWSQAARWCDYSGVISKQRVGMTLMCHPQNFRPSWMHARDYGFVAANPFGRKAMRKGAASKIVVQPGETMRLRYAVLMHAGPADEPTDCAAAYQDYLKLAGATAAIDTP